MQGAVVCAWLLNPDDILRAMRTLRLRNTRGNSSRSTPLTCAAPEARWAGLLFGSVNGRPMPSLTGVWRDGYGREIEVCTRDGGFALSIQSMHAAAAGVWDEQRSASVGMWQQWRETVDEERLFEEGSWLWDSRLHSRGFFEWGVDYERASEEAASAAEAYTANILGLAGGVSTNASDPNAPIIYPNRTYLSTFPEYEAEYHRMLFNLTAAPHGDRTVAPWRGSAFWRSCGR